MLTKKRKNILITGANGFVGKALVRELLKTGDSLFLVSRDEKLKYPEATGFYGDLTDKKFCRKIVKDIDIVYYLAGFRKNIAVHTGSPFEALSQNVLPFITFLEAAKISKIKTIVYSSSTHVEYTMSEKEKIDGYVWGKYINELILKSFNKETNIEVKTVRYAAIYGPGNDFNPKSSNIIPSLIVKVAEAKDEITIWGNGKRLLQFVYIDDVARTLVTVSHSEGNFFVIGNSQNISVLDLVKKIMKLMDKKLKICKDLTKPDKPTKLVVFNSSIKPKVSLEQGLIKTIKDYNKQYKKSHA